MRMSAVQVTALIKKKKQIATVVTLDSLRDFIAMNIVYIIDILNKKSFYKNLFGQTPIMRVTEPPYVGPWEQWEDCDVTCEGGSRTRTRECIYPQCWNEEPCTEPLEEEGTCNEDVCCPGNHFNKK